MKFWTRRAYDNTVNLAPRRPLDVAREGNQLVVSVGSLIAADDLCRLPCSGQVDSPNCVGRELSERHVRARQILCVQRMIIASFGTIARIKPFILETLYLVSAEFH